jgi:hypothetical protein
VPVAALTVFRDLLTQLTDVARQDSVSITLGKCSIAAATCRISATSTVKTRGRIENLMELVSAAREYETRAPEPVARRLRRSVVAAVRRRRRGGTRDAACS